MLGFITITAACIIAALAVGLIVAALAPIDIEE